MTTVPDTTTGFEPGELVNVTIRGARIDAVGVLDGTPTLELGSASTPVAILNPQAPGVSIERVAPKEWPPQPGDVWANDRGGRFFATRVSGWPPNLVATDGKKKGAEGALNDWGPLHLAARDGWAPAAVDEPEVRRRLSDAEKRAELIAGLRELADLLESRPDLPFTPSNIIWNPGREQLDEWAQVFGTQAKDGGLDADGHRHWGAEGAMRGLPLRAYWIEPETAADTPPPATTLLDLDEVREVPAP